MSSKNKFNKKILINTMSENDGILKAFDKIILLKKKIILVVKKKKLIGTVTDGDLRKAQFFKKKNLKIKDFMNRNPRVIKNGVKNFKLKNLYNQISFVPVLDKKNNLIDLADINKVKNIKFDNQVIIFAGGFGKRLHPYTKKIPKPMLKIKNKPNLETLIKKIKKSGFANITITLFYKNKYIKKKLKEKKINFFTEKKPLGTAGSLANIKFKNNLPILAINADLITDLDLKNLLFFHNSYKSDFTISVKDRSFEVPFATINIENNRIKNLVEKPKKNYLFNAGIYMVNQNVIRKIISKNKKIDMPDFINKALKRNYKILPFYHREKWIDFGTLKEYLMIKK